LEETLNAPREQKPKRPGTTEPVPPTGGKATLPKHCFLRNNVANPSPRQKTGRKIGQKLYGTHKTIKSKHQAKIVY